ncbi:MAG: hypothetical protein [Microvirus sp.]|nr:MAG: hypothetical protein [Microvirus sp.]
MQFNHRYKYLRPDGETNSGEVIVDSIGYQTVETQITNLIHAGVALREAQKGSYDTDITDNLQAIISDDYNVDYGADIVEVEQSANELNEKQQALQQKQYLKQKQLEELKQKQKQEQQDVAPVDNDALPKDSAVGGLKA